MLSYIVQASLDAAVRCDARIVRVFRGAITKVANLPTQVAHAERLMGFGQPDDDFALNSSGTFGRYSRAVSGRKNA
jgi:hypothetical protein